MVAVRINGEESGVNGSTLAKLTDLIELVKSEIDPEHIITGILIDGRELEDADWVAQLSRYNETTILEIQTATPSEFVSTRMRTAADVVSRCFFKVRDARKGFQTGDHVDGNRKLVEAVKTLKAFVDWYGSILAVTPAEERTRYDNKADVDKIAATCTQICQQQLYQSWWALGETLQSQLEPELDKLEDTCRKFNTQH